MEEGDHDVRLAPSVISKLMKEIRVLSKSPPEGITILFDDGNVADLQAEIQGPVNTPFEGGVFRIRLKLGSDYPKSAPKGTFLTKIFHPNVSKTGEICVNTLKKDWKPTLGITHVLLVIRCLLIVPNPASALNEEAGKLLLEHYDDYARRAKLMTKIHAMPKDAPEDTKENTAQNAGAGAPPADASSTSKPAGKKTNKKKKKTKTPGLAAIKQKSRKRL